jgi:hypothetical protein
MTSSKAGTSATETLEPAEATDAAVDEAVPRCLPLVPGAPRPPLLDSSAADAASPASSPSRASY